MDTEGGGVQSLHHRSGSVHQYGGKVGSDTSELGYGLCSLANPLFPDEKESEEDEFGVFDHFVCNIEVHVSWGFVPEEASPASDPMMGLDDDGFRFSVYELNRSEWI